MEKVDVIIGNVKDEIHNIAKLLFIEEIEKKGFSVLDLGVSVSKKDFVNKVKERRANILVLTGLLKSAIKYMKKITQSLKKEDLRKDIQILVAGPNVNDDWLRESGADAIANNIPEAVDILLLWKENWFNQN